MAENILAAACESETRKAAKRMRLEIYQTSQVPCSRQEGARRGRRGEREDFERVGKAFSKACLEVTGLRSGELRRVLGRGALLRPGHASALAACCCGRPASLQPASASLCRMSRSL